MVLASIIYKSLHLFSFFIDDFIVVVLPSMDKLAANLTHSARHGDLEVPRELPEALVTQLSTHLDEASPP